MGCAPSQNNKEMAEIPSGDQYQKKQLIGVGHFGRVYKALYYLDKKQYAYKQIDQIKQIDLQQFQSIYDSHIKKLMQLRHDKITKYYYHHFFNNMFVIITQLSQYGTLLKKIQNNGKLNEEQTKIYSKQILQGLLYLHKLGVYHNDLKPNNILIFPNDQIKLTDYGIASIYDSRLSQHKKQTLINNFKIDNIPYMAPEIVKNLGVSQYSDVWSFGCVVIQMLTGKKAWSNLGKNDQIMKKVTSVAIPPLPKQISLVCENFLQCCLAVIPSQRLKIQQLLNHQFITGKVVQIKNKNIQQDSIQNIELSPLKTKTIQASNRQVQKSNINQKNKIINQKEQKSNKKMSNLVKITRDAIIIDKNVIVINPLDNANSRQKINNNSPKLIQNQDNIVMLNNQPIRLDQKRNKIQRSRQRLMTQQSQQQRFVPRRNTTKDIYLTNQINNINSRVTKSKNNTNSFSQDLDNISFTHKSRIQTQPIIDQNNKQYFKRPLKLLKMKMKELKMNSNFNKQISQMSKPLISKQLQKLYQQQQDQDQQKYKNSKLRSYTQTSRQQVVINTALAKAQRDHYIQVQKALKKRRDDQRKKWENELKNGKQVLKKQLSSRYYAY